MIWIALTLAAASPSPIVLTDIRGWELVRLCEGAPTDLTQTFCTGYILGAFDSMSLSRQICPILGGATTLQAVTVGRLYLQGHVSEWNNHPADLVRRAMLEAFPCRRH